VAVNQLTGAVSAIKHVYEIKKKHHWGLKLVSFPMALLFSNVSVIIIKWTKDITGMIIYLVISVNQMFHMGLKLSYII
jgi:hypothetical protein